MKQILYFIICLTCFNEQIISQKLLKVAEVEKLAENYNIDLNNPESLSPFLKKLKEQENNKNQKIRIVHIGDSHLQAGYLTHHLKTKLQSKFGNAGMGMVFPYKVAHTNGPSDSYSFSNVTWSSTRNVYKNMQTGISGHRICTKQTNSILKMAVNSKNELDYAFDKITLFHPRKNNFTFELSTAEDRDVIENASHSTKTVYYKVKSGDNLWHISRKFKTSVTALQKLNALKTDRIKVGQKLKVRKKQQWTEKIPSSAFSPLDYQIQKEDTHSVIRLTEPVEYIFFNSLQNTASKPIEIDGMLLENTLNNGILYNTIGVNGAMFSNYNDSNYFFEQLPILQADLIVISLGTNEISNNKKDIVEDLQLLCQNLKQTLGEKIPILITSPYDYRKNEARAAITSKEIIDFVTQKNYPHIDLHKSLGGKNSMRRLQQRKLAQKDGVHLTANGYYLVGELIYKALIQAYNTFENE
ncbi:MAG: LysM peptidoglycan-binding domain-containing protein [Flavicella sp.]